MSDGLRKTLQVKVHGVIQDDKYVSNEMKQELCKVLQAQIKRYRTTIEEDNMLLAHQAITKRKRMAITLRKEEKLILTRGVKRFCKKHDELYMCSQIFSAVKGDQAVQNSSLYNLFLFIQWTNKQILFSLILLIWMIII